jgi:hypothetical protein
LVDGARRLGARWLGAPRPPALQLGPLVQRAIAAVLALFAIGSASSALNQNDFPSLRHEPIPVLEQGIACLGLPQAWARFAPDVPSSFKMMVVDATTSDERQVDPLNRAALGWQGAPWTSVPDRLGYDTFWHNYLRTLGTPAMSQVLPLAERWVTRYPARTGRAEDKLTAYTFFVVVAYAPAPGGTAGSTQRYPLLSRSAHAPVAPPLPPGMRPPGEGRPMVPMVPRR